MTACTRFDDFESCIATLIGALEADTQVRRAGMQPPGVLGRILRGAGSWDAFLARYTSCVSSESSASLVSDLGMSLLHSLLRNMREDLTPDKDFFSALIQSQTLFTHLISSLAPNGENRSSLHGSFPPGWEKYLIHVTALLETCSDRILNRVEDQLLRRQYSVSFVRICSNANLFEVLETLLRRERRDVAFICRFLTLPDFDLC